jgi:hypothetical protein
MFGRKYNLISLDYADAKRFIDIKMMNDFKKGDMRVSPFEFSLQVKFD